MSKLYRSCYVFLAVFFSLYSFADQVSDKPIVNLEIPSIFKKLDEPITLNNMSIFYNQQMEKRMLENFDNRFIIVHFWASWCIECRDELVVLDKLQKDFRKKALLVIAISEDFKPAKDLDEFFTKNKIEYLDIYFDKGNKIYNDLAVNYLPVTYLVDFNGDIIAQSKPGIVINWDDQDLIKFLDWKVTSYQLLPPEFKKFRDKYEIPKDQTSKNDKKQDNKKPDSNKKKSSIFIN